MGHEQKMLGRKFYTSRIRENPSIVNNCNCIHTNGSICDFEIQQLVLWSNIKKFRLDVL